MGPFERENKPILIDSTWTFPLLPLLTENRDIDEPQTLMSGSGYVFTKQFCGKNTIIAVGLQNKLT